MCRIDHPCAKASRICSIEWTLLACCVCPRHGTKILCRHMFLARPVGPTIVMAIHNNNDILMLHYEDLLNGIRVSSAKLKKSFRTNIYCPTPKHVTTQLFRNFYYQEFYYTGRRIQLKMKTNLFVMPYQAITKLSWTYSTTP